MSEPITIQMFTRWHIDPDTGDAIVEIDLGDVDIDFLVDGPDGITDEMAETADMVDRVMRGRSNSGFIRAAFPAATAKAWRIDRTFRAAEEQS